MTSPWAPALDALEEWLRRATEQSNAAAPPSPEVPLPETPVPDELRLRAQVVLQQLDALHVRTAAHRARLHRAYTYRR